MAKKLEENNDAVALQLIHHDVLSSYDSQLVIQKLEIDESGRKILIAYSRPV